MDLKRLCVVCHTDAPFVCSLCESVWYCGEAHQRTFWPKHREVCAGRRSDRKPDDLVRRNTLRREAVQLLGQGEVPDALNRALDSLRITFSLLGAEHVDLVSDYLLLIDVYQKFGLNR
jgi:hypothetical protein